MVTQNARRLISTSNTACKPTGQSKDKKEQGRDIQIEPEGWDEADGMDVPTTGPARADTNPDPPDAAIIPTSKQQDNPRHEETATETAAESSLFSKAILWSQSQWQSQLTTTRGRSGSRPRQPPSSSGSVSPHRITPSATPPPPPLAIYTGEPSSTHDGNVNYYHHPLSARFDGRGHYSHRRLPSCFHDTTFGLTQPDINTTMSLLIVVAKAAQFTDAFLTALLVPLIPTILETRAGVHHKHGMLSSSYYAFSQTTVLN